MLGCCNHEDRSCLINFRHFSSEERSTIVVTLFCSDSSLAMNDMKTDIIVCSLVRCISVGLLYTGAVSTSQESLNYKIEFMSLTAFVPYDVLNNFGVCQPVMHKFINKKRGTDFDSFKLSIIFSLSRNQKAQDID